MDLFGVGCTKKGFDGKGLGCIEMYCVASGWLALDLRTSNVLYY